MAMLVLIRPRVQLLNVVRLMSKVCRFACGVKRQLLYTEVDVAPSPPDLPMPSVANAAPSKSQSLATTDPKSCTCVTAPLLQLLKRVRLTVILLGPKWHDQPSTQLSTWKLSTVIVAPAEPEVPRPFPVPALKPVTRARFAPLSVPSPIKLTVYGLTPVKSSHDAEVTRSLGPLKIQPASK